MAPSKGLEGDDRFLLDDGHVPLMVEFVSSSVKLK
ncbi:hypothetical protein CCACVL1_27304 [Corchorus capsularis]|uniref:Uncharacterized protein n=1 Tax=Corchorus capsularis TaxID=210143 RepID=A0A1R3GB89_COCAP|nr:hypothetical protein CCACVL1_27304 [Corchorus capsularis]